MMLDATGEIRLTHPMNLIKQMDGPRRMEAVWEGLKKRRYSEANVEKVLGGNLYRLYKEVIG